MTSALATHRRQRGVALIAVLWIGLLVSAIAGAFILDTGTSARLARNFVDNAEVRALADGGVHLAAAELMRKGDGRKWIRDGRIYRWTVAGATLDIAAEDEAGKININHAGDPLLRGLFASAGLDPVASQDILEAIAADRRAAESTAGRSNAGADGVPRRDDRTFLALDALSRLPGMTASLYARLRPALTVYGDSEAFDFSTAPREALAAIPGVAPDDVEAFLAARAVADVGTAVQHFVIRGQARDYLTEAQGTYVTVKVLARKGDGTTFGREALLELRRGQGVPFVVREWRDGDADMFRVLPETVPAAEPGRKPG